jgi:hypothetical protein
MTIIKHIKSNDYFQVKHKNIFGLTIRMNDHNSSKFWMSLAILCISGGAILLVALWPSSINFNSDNGVSTGAFGLFSGKNSFSCSGTCVESVSVFFCPQEACADKLITQIDSAKKRIWIAIYSLTNEKISNALVRAKQRGVDVQIVFDYTLSFNNSSKDEQLADFGIVVDRRKGSGAMHNKFTVIDDSFVATGSFNYTNNADEKNEENLVFIDSNSINKEYANDFLKIQRLAE